MVAKKAMPMNSGDGETSYTNNSQAQKIAITKAWPVFNETLKDMLDDGLIFISKDSSCNFKMVDLGCSSGPNAILLASHIMDTIQDLCRHKSIDNNTVEFQVFLNDLPNNDFNNLFNLVQSSFYEKIKGGIEGESKHCFMYGLPGSFYGRLFPANSLNFAYSSYCLHWLSQIPQGLENNKENIHMAATSPPDVYEAYAKQYQRDFLSFLSSRAREIIPGGRMVLTFAGRSTVDPSIKDDSAHFVILAELLLELVNEGRVKETDLHSFNFPVYTACKQEVKAVIEKQGSFKLEKLEEFEVPWDGNDNVDFIDKKQSGRVAATSIRAFTEPILATHFESSIFEELFERLEQKLGKYLSRNNGSYFSITISLTRKLDARV